MPRFAIFALFLALAGCGSTEPRSFTITVSGPDALVGSRSQSPSGYYNLLDCTWNVTIAARGGQPDDVALIIGARLDAVAPGYHQTYEYDAYSLGSLFGTDHIATGETLTPAPWSVGSDVPAASGTYRPFTATVTYRFVMPSGETKEVAHTLSCRE